MRLRKRALLTLVAALVACIGCEASGPPGELREWRASDHVQPPVANPQEQSTGEPSAPPSPETMQRAAAALFQARCASCHGVGGAGDGAQAPTADMPDLTTAAYHEAHTDADIARAIRMGQGLMPAFGTQLNERGIAALLTHVRSLRAGE